jgi:hypothetical protein
VGRTLADIYAERIAIGDEDGWLWRHLYAPRNKCIRLA